MEKLVFVGIVGAIGVILYSLWQTIETQRAARKQARDGGRAFPTHRRKPDSASISMEDVQAAFQQRIHKWHRTQMPRWSGLKQSADALSGEKYSFVPGPRQRTRSLGESQPPAPTGVPQHFELVN